MQEATPASALTGGLPVSVRHLAMSYGDIDVVADVSFEVPGGSFLTLLGASGSGKTTVLRTIAGFEPDARGSIAIGGVDVSALPPHRRDIGMVFQRYTLFPHMTVAENVAFPLRQRGVGRHERNERVAEMLGTVGLQDLADRRPSQLSGGQQQRVALARALVFKPRVLLMDEPLAALDRRLREQMQSEIRTIQRRLHITTVYVTHDQTEAFALSDQVAVMNGGRIEQMAAPRELYDAPKTEFVARFVGDSNLLRGRSMGDNVIQLPDGSLIRCPKSLPRTGRVTAMVRPEKIDLCSYESRPAGNNVISGRVLDAVFLGEIIEYRVLAGDAQIVVRKQDQGRSASLAPATSVKLTWAIADTVVLS